LPVCFLAGWLANNTVDGVKLEKETVSIGQCITVGEITLLPVVRTFSYRRNVDRRLASFGSKNLIGIVALSPKWKRAMSVNGEDVPIGQYIEQVPELKELLQNM